MSIPRTGTNWIPAVAACLTVFVFAAGCSSDSGAAAPTPPPKTVTPSASPSTSPSTTASPSATAVSTPVPGAGLAVPTSADLAVTTRATAPLGRVSASLVAALSYDYRELDADLAAARAATTGAFNRQVTELQEKVVRPQATSQQVVTVTTVKAIGSVTRRGSATTYVVVTDQSTAKGGAAPQTSRSAVRLTADAAGRISALEALGGATSQTGSALLDGAATVLAPLVGPTAAGIAALRAASTPSFQPQVDALAARVGTAAPGSGSVTGVGLLDVSGSSYAVVVCLSALRASGAPASQQLRATFVVSGGRLRLDRLAAL